MISFVNRNSPHYFNKQNAANEPVGIKEQMTDGSIWLSQAKFESSPFQFIIPSLDFSGIMKFETDVKVKKPKMTLEKVESLFSLPIF